MKKHIFSPRGFEFKDKKIVRSGGQWNSDTLVRAQNGLNGLLNKLNDEYRSHTQSKEEPSELNYNVGQDSLYHSGGVLITNSKDSIHIKRDCQGTDYMGQIEASVSISDGQLRVTVEDNGSGIHPEIEPYLFAWLPQTLVPEHLLKMKMDKKLNLSGRMGDDLRQVKGNVEGLGGKIFYKNKGYNVGAIFGYEVPISSLSIPRDQSTR